MRKPVIDEKGVRHPSAEMLRQYRNWKPEHGMLGAEPQTALENIVREYLQEKHDEATASREKIAAFLAAEPRLFQQCWDRIERYQKQVSKYRHAHGMRPFDWRTEMPDTVRAVLRKKNGRNVLPLTALQREQRAAMAEIPETPLHLQKFKTAKAIAEILGGKRNAHLLKSAPETVPDDQLTGETWQSHSGANTPTKRSAK